jgi:hypothetical protein
MTDITPGTKPIDLLVAEIRKLLKDESVLRDRFDSKRLEAGRRLLALRARIEAGEAGAISWWSFFDKHLLSLRSRSDAEKIMAVASAEDPEGAAEEAARRNREHQARHRAKKAAYVSGNASAAEQTSAKRDKAKPGLKTRLTRIRDELRQVQLPSAFDGTIEAMQAQEVAFEIHTLAAEIVRKVGIPFRPRKLRGDELAEKLAKVLRLATSDKIGERNSAIAAANRIVADIGIRITATRSEFKKTEKAAA